MPITWAPALRASCTVSEPTPPAAPLTTTVSPACGWTARTAANAVTPATKRPPARIQSRARGLAGGGADRDDPAGEVGALAGREGARPHLVEQAGPDGDFAGVDAGRDDLDQNLVG